MMYEDYGMFLELLQLLQWEDDERKTDEEFSESFSFVRKVALDHFAELAQSNAHKRKNDV